MLQKKIKRKEKQKSKETKERKKVIEIKTVAALFEEMTTNSL